MCIFKFYVSSTFIKYFRFTEFIYVHYFALYSLKIEKLKMKMRGLRCFMIGQILKPFLIGTVAKAFDNV